MSANNINPDSVTIKQLFSNFTGKNLVSFCAVTIVVASSIFCAGLWFGSFQTEASLRTEINQHQSEILELKSKLEQSHNETKLSESKNRELTEHFQKYQSAYDSLQAKFAEQQQHLNSATVQLGRNSNCAFIHQEIVNTQRLIEHPWNLDLFEGSHTKEETEQKLSMLQRRLEGYQQQLSTCNKPE